MDLAADSLAERRVHELVALQGALARELGGDHDGLEMGVVGRHDLDLAPGEPGLDLGAYLVGVHRSAIRGGGDGPRKGRPVARRSVRNRRRREQTRQSPLRPAIMASIKAPQRLSEDTPIVSESRREPGQPLSDEQIARLGVDALEIEAAGLHALTRRIDGQFAAACRLLLACRGRVVVTGMGKSGHIAGKIAATLASTGTPAFFLHPAEAGHGDIGMIARDDVVVALSYSGETAEVLVLVPYLRRMGIKLVALTGNPQSSLARAAEVHLDVSVATEACPLNLAPTASTTATLAMGDAIAVSLLRMRGFTEEDFARSHPGGSLGRRLLTRVEDVMHADADVPRVSPATTVREGLLEMTRKGLGMTTVVDADGRLCGIFTDGDLRRALDRRVDVHATPIAEVMTVGCKTIGPQALAADAVHLLEEFRITCLVVTDADARVVGALNVHDLLRAGVM